MSTFCSLVILLAVTRRSVAQQCTPSLPAIIIPTRGENPVQLGGMYYVYRQMGLAAVSLNSRIQVTIVSPVVEPWFNHQSWQQWCELAYYPSSTTDACQNRFWTGTGSTVGLASGYEGYSSDNYTMVPATYSTLYSDDQNFVTYSCILARPDGYCAQPFIYAGTRKNPMQLSASEAEAFDTVITSIFSKYCVTARDIPKQIFTNSKRFCPFVDPPPCIGKAIMGMISSELNITADVGASRCKWPNSISSTEKFSAAPNGIYFLYRSLFGPADVPLNQQVCFTQLGSFPSAVINDTAAAFWIEYISHTPKSYTCNRAIIVASVVGSGLVTGLIAPDSGISDPQTFSLSTLFLDDSTVVYYGCAYQNLFSGFCDAPIAMHLTRKNPLTLTSAEKTVADALDHSFFHKYGCSSEDIPVVNHVSAQQACTFAGPDTCMQTYIAGYQQKVDGYKSITSSSLSRPPKPY